MQEEDEREGRQSEGDERKFAFVRRRRGTSAGIRG
jgi:hypothetical protein